jgi:hypothetical protein
MVYHSSLSLSDLFSRKRKDETADAGADWPVYPTKALAKFLTNLNARSQRLLVDLGPVVGTNVAFFGEELGCKIHVEDVFKDIDRHVTEDKMDALPSFLAKRFSQEDGTGGRYPLLGHLRLSRQSVGAGARARVDPDAAV